MHAYMLSLWVCRRFHAVRVYTCTYVCGYGGEVKATVIKTISMTATEKAELSDCCKNYSWYY